MKEEKEVKIEKMVLNIEGEKVSLSMEQAKKLKKILDELFGKEVIKEVIKENHYHDYWYRPYNTYVNTQKWNDNVVFCATANSKASMLDDYKSGNLMVTI